MRLMLNSAMLKEIEHAYGLGIISGVTTNPGKAIDAIHPNILAKTQFSPDGIQTVSRLSAKGIRANVTAIYSVSQALVAVRAGAAQVSIFTGPHNSLCDFKSTVARQVRQIIDVRDLDAEIVDCTRTVAETSMDFCTMDYSFLMQIFESPGTGIYMNKAEKQWNDVYGDATWVTGVQA